MSVKNNMHGRAVAFRGLSRAAIVLLVICAFAGCKKDQTSATPETGPATSAATAAADAVKAAPPQQAVSDQVNAMTADQLRESASKALQEQRLYAPAGDNAMEFYLALLNKQPDAPAVSSALTDLMPYALIATEQSIKREDFAEAQRLYALMDKTDPKAPALPRLKAAIAEGQVAVAKRAEQQVAQSEEQAKRQVELEKQRVADQQKLQQEAAQKLAAQQVVDAQAEAKRLADEKAAAAAAAAAAAKPATPAPQPAAPPPEPKVTNTLRPISTPSPNYPREAERRRRSGVVEVEFTVGTDGSVTSARIVSASPPRIFDRETLSAVNRWRFQPIGESVTTRRKIQFKPPN